MKEWSKRSGDRLGDRESKTFSLSGNEIPITFIPATDAAVFKASVITRLSTAHQTRPGTTKTTTTEVAATPSTEERRKNDAAEEEKAAPEGESSRKASGSRTVISIGPNSEMRCSEERVENAAAAAPLVSPETSTVDLEKQQQHHHHHRSTATVYLNAATLDESSTDPPQPPPPLQRQPEAPPRPSKSGASTPEEKEQEVSSSASSEEEEEEPDEEAFDPQNWGPERSIVVTRQPGQGLGISIVGGKVMNSIFIFRS